MTVHLTTFATENMTRARDLCIESGLLHGVEKAWGWNEHSLGEVGRLNGITFEAGTRGYSFWKWKPLIILKTMEPSGYFFKEPARDGDIIVYSDAGIEFIDNLKFIVDRMPPGEDIFLFANTWPHVDWCKADTIHAILPGAKFEDFGFQVQASLIFLRVSQRSRDFVSEWLSYCVQPHLIDDSPSIAPNAATFKEHRHDQSILHCLSVKHRIHLHWYPIVYNRFSGSMFVHEKGEHVDTYPPLAHHHRLRDHEWPSIP